jgi:hypothetical protein
MSSNVKALGMVPFRSSHQHGPPLLGRVRALPRSPTSTLLCSPPTPCPHQPRLRFPLPVAYLAASACSMPLGPTTRAPAYVSCVGDGSPALRKTGMYRGEARASQVTGPSSSYVPWSNTPPDMVHSSPTTRRSHCCLQVNQDPGHPGRLEVSGPHAPWPTCSHAYASPTIFLGSSQGLLPAQAGSPLAGRVLHPLDDERSFMKVSSLHSPSTSIAWSH